MKTSTPCPNCGHTLDQVEGSIFWLECHNCDYEELIGTVLNEGGEING